MSVERTALVMVTKLVEAAQKTWRRLGARSQLPKLLAGVRFTGGLEAVAKTDNRQPTTGAA
jgi:putative transposase